MPCDHDVVAKDTDDVTHRVRTPRWLDDPDVTTRWQDRLVPDRFRGVRLDPGRGGVRIFALAGLVVVVIAGIVVFRERPMGQPVPPIAAAAPTVAASSPEVARQRGVVATAVVGSVSASPTPADAEQPRTDLVVSVVGLVQHAGLVRLPTGARVADALAAAGGTRPGADTSGLNLAQRLLDGDQVMVGPAGPNTGPPYRGSTTIGAAGNPPSRSAPDGSSKPAAKVDLNSASEAQLDALPGVGPVTAAAIVTWRTTNGRFDSVDQLGEVDGIGPVRLARLRDLVIV